MAAPRWSPLTASLTRITIDDPLRVDDLNVGQAVSAQTAALAYREPVNRKRLRLVESSVSVSCDRRGQDDVRGRYFGGRKASATAS
jgi:hypothetical protein